MLRAILLYFSTLLIMVAAYLWTTHYLVNSASDFPIPLGKKISFWSGLIITVIAPSIFASISVRRAFNSGIATAFWKRTIVFGGIILSGIVLFVLGKELKTPPDEVKANELELPTNRITMRYDKSISNHKFDNQEQNQWKILEFQLSNESPGSTPEYRVELRTPAGKSYLALYNAPSSEVFFNFVEEFQYGWIYSPPPGDWKQPIYTVKADQIILNLLGIESNKN